MKNSKNLIDVVVPIYNEEDNLQLFIDRTEKVLNKIGTFKIIFCLDPSTDKSEKIITENIKKNTNLAYIKFSRRFGQPSAIMAGIHSSNSRYLVVIDADMQDPPELILDLYKKINQGFDVVLAKRSSRDGESIIKLIVSFFGYRIINFLSNIKIENDVGDFRIMSERVVKELKKIDEPDPFLRGLVSYVGFKETSLLYSRSQRYSGSGKYNRFFGSYKIGVNGIFSFSSKLLTYILFLGLFIFVTSTLLIFLILILFFFDSLKFPMGYTSIILGILFFGGIQLIAIGILGEYIGRVFDTVKKRPNYIIEKKVNI